MGSGARDTDKARGLSLRVPATILLCGLLLTTLFAVEQQRAAIREQALVFGNEAALERAALNEVVRSALDGFRDGIRFAEATHPGDSQSFQRFYLSKGSADLGDVAVDPGVTIIEAVEPDEIDALVARERATDPDFTINSFAPTGLGINYVVTRTENEIVTPMFALRGLNLGPIAEQSSVAFPEVGMQMYELGPDDPLVSFLDAFNGGSTSENIYAIVEPVPTGEIDGPRVWAARFFSPELVMRRARIDTNNRINVAVRIGDLVIDGNEGQAQVAFEDAEVKDMLAVEADGIQWEFLAWADDDMGIKTGLFDQKRAWAIGLFGTTLFAAIAMWREWQRRNLARANVELEHARMLATTDGLTGLLNREGFMQSFGELESNSSGTLFFLDLDGFKAINDTLGHGAGDDVLRAAAAAIRRNFRGADIVSRFGGDEFVAYAPLLRDDEVATTIASRIVESIAALDMPESASVSCSLGMATRRDASPEVHALIALADRAMYEAKEQGGNQVVATPA